VTHDGRPRPVQPRHEDAQRLGELAPVGLGTPRRPRVPTRADARGCGKLHGWPGQPLREVEHTHDGKTKAEIIRSLKRFIARELYHALTAAAP